MEKLKAKRRLFNIDFEHEGAHVALVGKHQGGAANGHTTLVTKATGGMPNLSETVKVDELEKALEQVQVTLSMEEFLEKFFNMYSYDAELLTKLLGFKTEYEDWSENMEAGPESHKDFLDERLDGITLMKSMHEGDSKEISKGDLLNILNHQQNFEKNGDTMKDKVETIEKSKFDEVTGQVTDLTKALEDTKADLEKALEVIKANEEAVMAKTMDARKASLESVLPADEVESTFESMKSLGDDAFANIVKNFKNKMSQEDQSEMMTEKGVDAEAETTEDEVGAVLALIKQRKAK